jgi:predicted dehydrogenase
MINLELFASNQSRIFKSLTGVGLIILFSVNLYAQESIRVVIAGLSHDHINPIIQSYVNGDIQIVGIHETDQQLVDRFKKNFKLDDSLFSTDLKKLLRDKKPDAVLAYNAIAEHLAVVEAAAPLGISVMVEKPLATTVKDAERMVYLANKHQIHLLTNYETSWYSSNHEVYNKVKNDGSVGPIRKMVVHDGHQGPKEIGVSKEFFQWLTDPVKNGGGAIIDFGCYGANLMTWLMDGQAPLAVTAITRKIKPEVYPHVDDDATILLEYPEATGIIEASWNWPFSIKDLEVFGKSGYIQAVNGNTIRSREKENLPYSTSKANELKKPYTDHLTYLSAVLKGNLNPENDLSSLNNNLIVVKILEAAKKSAKEGKRIIIAR